jgi:hypothetical protein
MPFSILYRVLKRVVKNYFHNLMLLKTVTYKLNEFFYKKN